MGHSRRQETKEACGAGLASVTALLRSESPRTESFQLSYRDSHTIFVGVASPVRTSSLPWNFVADYLTCWNGVGLTMREAGRNEPFVTLHP
ncbi:hypothetical protein V1264_014235 [Littorina saxatilis]|uniref:Uncharacterized protein n=1 Tax=Littorina saxatilis TaxID=31220 RepID=A0AAN9GKT1_9CAEN